MWRYTRASRECPDLPDSRLSSVREVILAARKKAQKKKEAEREAAKLEDSESKRKPKEEEPKKRTREPSRREVIAELFGEFNTPEHKVLAHANDAPNTYALRRPSGVMQLDIDTGGGIPSGGISMLSGEDNAGKTHLLFKYMAMHQRLYGDDSCIGMACIEQSFDFAQALHAGITVSIPDEILADWNKMREARGIPHYTAEERRFFKRQAGEFIIIRGATGEETLEAVLGIAARKLFGIIGLDSVSALLPQADADKSLDEEAKRAARANLMTQFFAHYYRHSTGLDGLNPTTLIFTQQVRSNQDRANAPSYLQRYIPDYAVTGARATRHGKLIDVMVKSGEKVTRTISGVKHIIGKEMKWEITKGKAGAHDNVYGSTNFYYDRGVDTLETVIETGQRLGTLVTCSDGLYSIRPETGEATDLGAPDVATLRKLMEVDFEFELNLRREILATAGIKCIYR